MGCNLQCLFHINSLLFNHLRLKGEKFKQFKKNKNNKVFLFNYRDVKLLIKFLYERFALISF